jgi:dCMP deaminase
MREDDYFMNQALLIAQRSADPSTQVGAALVSKDNRLISVGYNGFPKGTCDLPWDREGEWENTKYAYVCHAESNAIDEAGLNREKAIKGKIFVTLYPCAECAKRIISAGIKEVVYLDDKYINEPFCRAATRLLNNVGIHVRQYIPKQRISFNEKL